MSDLILSCTISRDDVEGGPFGALQMQDPGAYSVITAGPGAVSWVKHTAESDYMHGRVVVHQRKEVVTVPLSIRVYGADMGELDDRVAEMIRAFEQMTYRLRIEINGQVWRWDCESAEYDVDRSGEFDPHFLRALQQVYTFEIPRDPVPREGIF